MGEEFLLTALTGRCRAFNARCSDLLTTTKSYLGYDKRLSVQLAKSIQEVSHLIRYYHDHRYTNPKILVGRLHWMGRMLSKEQTLVANAIYEARAGEMIDG